MAKIKLITISPSSGQFQEMLQEIVDDGHKIIAILPTGGVGIDVIVKKTAKSDKKIEVLKRSPSSGQLEEILQAIAEDGYDIITILRTPGRSSIEVVASQR